MSEEREGRTTRRREFPRTSWGLIRRYQETSLEERRAALDLLIREYWGPVYFYVYRKWTRDFDRAMDLTQSFFLAFVEKDYVATVSPEKGRFRDYVLACLRNFLSKEKRRETTQKRKPDTGVVSLEEVTERGEPGGLASRTDDPTARFLAEWNEEVFQEAVQELRRRGQAADKSAAVEVFVRHDLARREERPSYEDLTRELGQSFHQVKNGLSWARKTFRTVLLEILEARGASELDLFDSTES